MKKLGETMEIFGFLGFLLSASGIDSGSKTNLIVLIVSMGVLALGLWLDNEWVDYREK